MNQNAKQTNNTSDPQKKKNGKRNLVILILMFLLLVCLFIVQCQLNKVKEEALAEQKLQEMPTPNEAAKLIQMIEGEDVEKYDALLSLAVTGVDYSWI